MAEVTLTAALRSNLLSLQNTRSLLDQTEQRLATGKKVNSALDNPSAFFASQSLTNRASDLSNLLDAQGQAVESLKATDQGITAITSFLQQAQAIAQQALSESNANGGAAPTDVASLVTQFNQVLKQITQLSNDSSYQGTNLLNNSSNSLTVTYNETATSTQVIQGVNFTAGSTGTQGTGYAAPVTGTLAIPATTAGVPADTVTINGQTAVVGGQTQAQLLSNLNAAGAAAANKFTASLNSLNQLVISSTTEGASLTIAGTVAGLNDTGLTAAAGASPFNAAANGGGLGITDASNGVGGLNWASASASADISASLTAVTNALTTVRAQASTFGENLSIIQTRQSFTTNLINTLKAGSDGLTLADTNAEGANLLALQTQQQLGISSLSIASQANQAILKLFP